MENSEIIFKGKTFPNELEFKKSLIIEAIKISFENNPKYHQTQILTTSVYRIMVSIFVDNKKIIFLDAPTGTGKSIIGYMIHFCYYYIREKLCEALEKTFENTTTYTLTSSKILQEQLEHDFNTFEMHDHFTMLKGMSNYECKVGTKQMNTYVGYADRTCKGMKRDQIENMECFVDCEYMQRRMKASMSPSAVVNYAYFLTIMNARFSPYFSPRNLVIADEGHLVPQIVTGMFNIDLTLFKLNKIAKVYSGIEMNFGSKLEREISPIKTEIIELYKFFGIKNHTIEGIIDHLKAFSEVCTAITDLMGIVEKEYKSIYAVFKEMWFKDFADITDKMGVDLDKNFDYLESLKLRPMDIFIEGQSIGNNMFLVGNYTIPNKEYFKFVIRDLSEAQVTKRYFLDKTDICLFMSATIGDIHEFGTLLGLEQNQYTGFSLPSTFDFSKSPIYLTNSGYLNYNSFEANIQKVLQDCIKIVTRLHPDYGGVIHTSTFQITNMIKELLIRQDPKNLSRYLFYENSNEKDIQIAKIRASGGKIPYIIIGPSLYEGLDLKDDLGRLNIIVKAPYAGMDNYTRKKMVRYPFFYERETLEKLQQAIGRTNRNKNDWSITYLLDGALEKLVWKLPQYITGRIKTKRI